MMFPSVSGELEMPQIFMCVCVCFMETHQMDRKWEKKNMCMIFGCFEKKIYSLRPIDDLTYIRMSLLDYSVGSLSMRRK